MVMQGWKISLLECCNIFQDQKKNFISQGGHAIFCLNDGMNEIHYLSVKGYKPNKLAHYLRIKIYFRYVI